MTATKLLRELETQTPGTPSYATAVQKVQTHALVSIARSLDELAQAGMSVYT